MLLFTYDTQPAALDFTKIYKAKDDIQAGLICTQNSSIYMSSYTCYCLMFTCGKANMFINSNVLIPTC